MYECTNRRASTRNSAVSPLVNLRFACETQPEAWPCQVGFPNFEMLIFDIFWRQLDIVYGRKYPASKFPEPPVRDRRPIILLQYLLHNGAYRLQNMQVVQEGPVSKHYFHPYMQTLFASIGEFICLLVFFLLRWRSPQLYRERSAEARKAGKKPLRLIVLAIPAAGDFIGSTFANISVNFLLGSVYQLIKGGLLLTTAGFSYWLTRKRIKRNHIAGCTFALVGLIIVGSYNIAAAEKAADPDLSLELLGYGTLLASLMFTGFYYSYEQKLMAEHDIDPMHLTGVEGVFNLLYCGVFLLVVSFVPCPFSNQSLCVFSDDGSAHMERADVMLKEMLSNQLILWMVLLYTIVIWGVFYTAGIIITKEINALARSLLKLTQILVTWSVGIIVTLTVGSVDKAYRWEHVTFWAISLQLLGLLFIAFGTLLYGENVNIKCFMDHPEPEQLESESLLTGSEDQLKA